MIKPLEESATSSLDGPEILEPRKDLPLDVKDFWVWVINCTPLLATMHRITRRSGTGGWIENDFPVGPNCQGSCEAAFDCPGEPAFGVDCLDPPFGVEFLLTTEDGRTFISTRLPVRPRRFGECKVILCLDAYQPVSNLPEIPQRPRYADEGA